MAEVTSYSQKKGEKTNSALSIENTEHPVRKAGHPSCKQEGINAAIFSIGRFIFTFSSSPSFIIEA
jgi:hypothetical protein